MKNAKYSIVNFCPVCNSPIIIGFENKTDDIYYDKPVVYRTCEDWCHMHTEIPKSKQEEIP